MVKHINTQVLKVSRRIAENAMEYSIFEFFILEYGMQPGVLSMKSRVKGTEIL